MAEVKIDKNLYQRTKVVGSMKTVSITTLRIIDVSITTLRITDVSTTEHRIIDVSITNSEFLTST
jgi:hypothetical protein